MTEVFTQTTVGHKTFEGGIELIPTTDAVLAHQGDKEAKQRIEELLKRNELRRKLTS